jgi:hypothetical protein
MNNIVLVHGAFVDGAHREEVYTGSNGIAPPACSYSRTAADPLFRFVSKDQTRCFAAG